MTDYYAPLPAVPGASSGAVNGANVDLGPTEFVDSSTSPPTKYLRQPVTVGDPAAVGSVASVKPASTPATNADGALVITPRDTPGSVGVDYSSVLGDPALPVIGSNFGSSGPYANYVLTITVPANTMRKHIEAWNTSGAQIALLLDDGSASFGNVPGNGTVFALGGGSGAGAQGGAWDSPYDKGRLQVFSPITTAITFSGPLSSATSGTLTSSWTGPSGAGYVTFSNGTVQLATFVNGSTAVSWPQAVSATSAASVATAQIAVRQR